MCKVRFCFNKNSKIYLKKKKYVQLKINLNLTSLITTMSNKLKNIIKNTPTLLKAVRSQSGRI